MKHPPPPLPRPKKPKPLTKRQWIEQYKLAEKLLELAAMDQEKF